MKSTEDVERRRRIKELALRQQMAAMAEETAVEEPTLKETKTIEYIPVSHQEEESEVLLKPVYVTPRVRSEEQRETELEREHKEQAHQMLANYIKRETSRMLFDEERGTGPFDPLSVDDTDGLHPAEEEEAWRLRELQRHKRDRDERERWEREKLELERIRNLTPEERSEIDREKWAEWERDQGSSYRYLQKYYHKGAFFQDDELLKRDYNQPTGADLVNREQLPSVMQVKNFGKKSRTKWTHLTGEDTTNFEFGWGHRKNTAQYRNVNRMGGMRGDLEPPSKRRP